MFIVMYKDEFIYILMSGDYFKIGYTTDIKKRMMVYKTHNPNCVLFGYYHELENYFKVFEKIINGNNSYEWNRGGISNIIEILSSIQKVLDNSKCYPAFYYCNMLLNEFISSDGRNPSLIFRADEHYLHDAIKKH